MISYSRLIVVLLVVVLAGCDKPERVDAGTTRAFWTDVRRLAVPLEGSSLERFAAAADGLDRLSTSRVDPQVAQLSRDMSALYRKHAKVMNDAVERGRTGQGLNLDTAQINALVDESNRIADRMVEVDKYVRDAYHY